MTDTYRDELQARFGLDLGLDGEVPDDAWLRRVLLRRTQRRYADRPVPESLVRLLLAAAFSASSKSDLDDAENAAASKRRTSDSGTARSL